MANVQGEEIYRWWTDLNTDFVRLNQNYQDYVRELNGIRAEELMKTKEFLIFKDKLIEYLRSFIKGLQQNVGIIEELFQGVTPEIRDKIFLNLIEYQKSIPRTDVQNAEETEKMYEQMIRERYQNIYNWFCSGNETENEAVKIFDTTNEIIRRITRYAAQMSEKNSIGSNRREEYRKVAEIFMKCKTEDEAHCMAAMVFGLERPCHIEGELIRETDSMNQGVYEETPMHFTLKPRIRNYREKSKRSGIREMSKEKQEMRQRILQQQKEELAKIRSLEIEGRIDFSNLPVLEAREREILLKWLSDVMESTDFTARTEDGRKYTLDRSRMSEQCKVYCTDGIFTMPCFSFVFLEEES